MGILAWIVVGLVAGVLASLVMGGTGYGIIGDIVIGIVGAFIGGWLFSVLGISTPMGGMGGTIFVAFIGASYENRRKRREVRRALPSDDKSGLTHTS